MPPREALSNRHGVRHSATLVRIILRPWSDASYMAVMLNIFGQKLLTEAEIRLKLSEAAREAGSLFAWCRANGVDAGAAYKAVKGRIPFPPNIAAALGFTKVIRYAPADKPR